MPLDSRSVQTASHWGVYNVEVDNRGTVSGSSPFKEDPHPASYVGGLPEMVQSPLRIDQPYVRSGYLRGDKTSRRGGDSFVPVTWEHALSLVASELGRVKREFGNEASYGGSYGWASAGRLHHGPSVLKRLLGLHGGYVDKRGNHSFGAALGIAPYVLGRSDITDLVASWPDVIANTELIVLFGGAAIKNTQIDAGGAVLHESADFFRKAAERGIRFVNISPSRNDLPSDVSATWIPIKPHTDVAMMLGIAHTLVVEGNCDRSFLDRYCHGYEEFEAYLLGRQGGPARTAEWASSITGVPVEVIKKLAHDMWRSRTLVNASWSIQRADHGEQPVWMTITLAAMLGQIGLPGRGFSLGFGAVNGIMVPRVAGMPRPTLPLGPNAIKSFVPVGRVADMLLCPGEQIDCFGQVITLPDIKLIYSIGGNPFHHNANLNHFLEAWQRPDTIIVHEPWWSPPAKHADIVLPATTTMERNDILAHENSRYWIAMRKVIEPVGQARNDFDILANIAYRLGFGEAYTEGRNEMGWLRHMYEGARAKAEASGFTPPDFDEFWNAGKYAFPQPATSPPILSQFREWPDDFPLKTPSGKIEIFSDTIKGFAYDDCPPHATWLEPREWLGSKIAESYPLHLLSNQPSTRLHSQLDPASTSVASKIAGREPIAIHPLDARERGIVAGDIVEVFNSRGAFIAGAVIVDYLQRGVLQIATGAWYDPFEGGVPGTLEKHGNPNVVTLDTGTSKLSQGSIAQTALVEIKKCASPPPVTAFALPRFEEAATIAALPERRATI